MNDLLPLLAIETSGEICSVAVFKEEDKYSEVNLRLKNVHSQMLVPAIEQALSNINLDSEQIKTVAVSIGPGSFTGLRIGLATAKGFAMGVKAAICPVPTLDAAALKISGFLPAGSKFRIVMNANITDVYSSVYSVGEDFFSVVEKPALISKEELAEINDEMVFSDFSFNNKIKQIELTGAKEIGKWALHFGKERVTKDYDFLEPEYFQQFVPKVKK